MRSIVIVTPSTYEPVTIDEVRTKLRLAAEEDSELIWSCIKSARAFFEEHDDRKLTPQTWKLVLDCFPYPSLFTSYPWPHGEIEIPLRPVTAVNSIKYIDGNGVQQTLAPTEYLVSLNSFLARIEPAYGKTWPSIQSRMDAVEVEFNVGYDADNLPDNLRNALIMMAGHLYENREATSDAPDQIMTVPMGYEALVGANRRIH